MVRIATGTEMLDRKLGELIQDFERTFPLMGYLCWVPTVGGHASYAAFGRGGQLLLVIPDLDAVAVSTAAPTVAAPNLLQLLETYAIPALAGQS